MDPNATLKRLRELAAEILNADHEDEREHELADLVDGMDDWLSRGGLLPEGWKR